MLILAAGFNDALRKGSLEEFVKSVPTWWSPLVNHDLTGWSALYYRNELFRKWEEQFPQRTNGVLPQMGLQVDQSEVL